MSGKESIIYKMGYLEFSLDTLRIRRWLQKLPPFDFYLKILKSDNPSTYFKCLNICFRTNGTI